MDVGASLGFPNVEPAQLPPPAAEPLRQTVLASPEHAGRVGGVWKYNGEKGIEPKARPRCKAICCQQIGNLAGLEPLYATRPRIANVNRTGIAGGSNS
jgi:hypothetical protein